MGKNALVRTGERPLVQLGQCEPAEAFLRRWRLRTQDDAESTLRNPVTSDGVFDLAQRFAVRSNLEKVLQRSRRSAALPGDFEIRKLPQTRVHDASGSLRHEELSIALYDESVELAAGRSGAPAEVRQFIHAAVTVRGAVGAHGAEEALRILRRANGRAEFHEGLVQR